MKPSQLEIDMARGQGHTAGLKPSYGDEPKCPYGARDMEQLQAWRAGFLEGRAQRDAEGGGDRLPR